MSSTSATFFAASSSASPATPLPITNALTVLEVSFAICCAAASVSKLVLFHFPCRCSAMTRIFMCNLSLDRGARVTPRQLPPRWRRYSDHPGLKLQLLDQLCGYFFWRAGQKFRLLCFCRHVDFFHALRGLD